MTDKITKFPDQGKKPIDPLVGPFEEYRVVVDGRMIPRLTGFKQGSETWLVVDRRFSYGVPHEHAYGVAWLLANALAIGEGYAFLGSPNKDMPFAPMAAELDGVPTE